MARKKQNDLGTVSRDWRDVIRQQAGRGIVADSKVARGRAIKKWIHRAAFFIFLAAVGCIITWAWLDVEAGDRAAVVQKRADIHFTSSEQQSLTQEWFLRYTGMDQGATPGIFEIKKMLEKVGQIKEAPVTKLPNGDLKIHVVERKPILRMNAQLKTGEIVTRVVATDGVVYEGINYGPAIINKMPVLILAVAPQDKGNFDYVPGMEYVSDLLLRAFNYQVYGTWRYVSVKEFPNGDIDYPGAVIRVTVESPEFPELRDVIFSARPERYTEELKLYVSRDFQNRLRNQLNQITPKTAPYGYDLFLSMMNRESPGRPKSQPRMIPRDGN